MDLADFVLFFLAEFWVVLSFGGSLYRDNDGLLLHSLSAEECHG
jgi:hypothetical protein